MSRHALDEARAPEPLPVPLTSSEPIAGQPGDGGSERAVLYEQVLEGLHQWDTDAPRRTMTDFHDWFTPTMPVGEPTSADEAPGPQKGDARC